MGRIEWIGGYARYSVSEEHGNLENIGGREGLKESEGRSLIIWEGTKSRSWSV
jgi:hypothetical protein